LAVITFMLTHDVSTVVALLLSGAVATLMGQWWGEAWVWLSLLALVAIIVARSSHPIFDCG